MKILIVGGVAGGASAAARARRLSEDAKIIIFERGSDPSFANCGLPYYIGGEIEDRGSLLVAPKQRLEDRYGLDVRVRTEVTAIDRVKKTVQVRSLEDRQEYEESYDKLILSTGASPFRPPIEGIDLPGIYTLRDLKDADRLYDIATSGMKRALIVGAGFIGIELAESLVRRGLSVTIVEMVDQILPPWDKEMTTDLVDHLRSHGVTLRLGDAAEMFRHDGSSLIAELRSGESLNTDFVVLCIGVRPENQLAVDAGVECGQRGGVRTNVHMQTSDSDIYAIGDVVEVSEFVSGTPTLVPLAGPANRQGRIAADHIFGRESAYRGTQGTAVVGIFDFTAAMTGLSEKVLRRMRTDFEKVYVHPTHHAGYYPNAEQLSLKLLFSSSDGRVLGAQAVGRAGVDKRIDVLATAIQAGMTVYDLEEIELCYAPQYGSAKDPINIAGFVAAGLLRGDQRPVQSEDIADLQSDGAILLDVRTTDEYSGGHLGDSVNIPSINFEGKLATYRKKRRSLLTAKLAREATWPRGYYSNMVSMQ